MKRPQSINLRIKCKNLLNSLMLKKVFKGGQENWRGLERDRMIMKK